MTCDPTANNDVDGDSDGTSIKMLFDDLYSLVDPISTVIIVSVLCSFATAHDESTAVDLNVSEGPYGLIMNSC